MTLRLRYALIAALVAPVWWGRSEAAETCPMRAGQVVTAVEVFDGPVEDMATLVPDNAGKRAGHWTLGYVYAAGRVVTVRCKYSGGAAVDVKLPAKVERCEYRSDAKGALTVSCR